MGGTANLRTCGTADWRTFQESELEDDERTGKRVRAALRREGHALTNAAN